MPTGDVYRIGIEWTLNSAVRALTTFGLVEGTGLGGLDPMADVVNHVITTLGATPSTGFSANASITAVQATDVQPGTRGGYRVPAGPFAGSAALDMLPPQDAIVVHWSTGLKGKANNGRMYLPGIPETGQVAGNLSSDILNPASAFVSLLFDQYASDGTVYQLSIISYVPGSSPRALRAAVPITAFSIDSVVRSMRSRQLGRGQ